MSLVSLFDNIKSGVVQLVFLTPDNRVLSMGTGFLANGYLITNNHVFRSYPGCGVWIRGSDEPKTPSSSGLILPDWKFASYFVAGSDENNCDYAILKIPELDGISSYQFTLEENETVRIGMDVALLGYPFDRMNLCIHHGIISSILFSNEVKILQIDASVNAGNSGGPLVDTQTGHVVGLVTRKGTGLTEAFRQLKEVLALNLKQIRQLREGPISVTLAGIDPAQSLEASQTQLLALTAEIERSANVGIGYAVSVKYLVDEIRQIAS